MPRIISDIDNTVLRDGEAVEAVVAFLKQEAEEVVFLTNRPEAERDKTVADLEKVGVEYERLIMNPGETPAPEFKAGVIQAEYLDKGLRVDGFIDDREDTRNAVEKLGVRTLSPAEVEAYMAAEENEAEEPEAQAAEWAERTVTRLDQGDKVARRCKFMTPEESVANLSQAVEALTSERDDLRASVEKLAASNGVELEALKVEASAKDARLAELTAALEGADKLVAELSQKVAALESSAITASAEAAKIAASVGVEPVEQSPADAPVAKTDDDIRAEFLAMPFGKERTAFFNKNRKAILGK